MVSEWLLILEVECSLGEVFFVSRTPNVGASVSRNDRGAKEKLSSDFPNKNRIFNEVDSIKEYGTTNAWEGNSSAYYLTLTEVQLKW